MLSVNPGRKSNVPTEELDTEGRQRWKNLFVALNLWYGDIFGVWDFINFAEASRKGLEKWERKKWEIDLFLS